LLGGKGIAIKDKQVCLLTIVSVIGHVSYVLDFIIRHDYSFPWLLPFYYEPPTLSIVFGKIFGRFLIDFVNDRWGSQDGAGPLFPLTVFVILRSSALGGEWKQFYNLLRLLRALNLLSRGISLSLD
jgi:hypothetical protein